MLVFILVSSTALLSFAVRCLVISPFLSLSRFLPLYCLIVIFKIFVVVSFFVNCRFKFALSFFMFSRVSLFDPVQLSFLL